MENDNLNKNIELQIGERVEGNVKIVNFTELREIFNSKLERFKGLVYGEEQLDDAKKDRAYLNNVIKQFNDSRKREEEIYMQGFMEFKNNIKLLITDATNVVDEIDKQVKSFETRDKLKKKEDCILAWADTGFKKVKFEQIFNEKWLNKTYSIKKVVEDINNAILEIENNLRVIESFCGGDLVKTENIKAKYLISLDLNSALATLEEENKIKEVLNEETNKELVDDLSITLKIYGSAEELKTLALFLKSKKYKYERI